MLTVSNFHYIRKNFNAKYPSIFGVTPDDFRKQLGMLKNLGDFVEPNFLVENLTEVLESKDNHFLITFDDGLKEQFDSVLPILDELNIPAFFYKFHQSCRKKSKYGSSNPFGTVGRFFW